MDKIIIEARVNELAPRDENPNVPFLPDDIIRDAQACYEAGASITTPFSTKQPTPVSAMPARS
jgi:uncharacterized protein (DUF849 family)